MFRYFFFCFFFADIRTNILYANYLSNVSYSNSTICFKQYAYQHPHVGNTFF